MSSYYCVCDIKVVAEILRLMLNHRLTVHCYNLCSPELWA